MNLCIKENSQIQLFLFLKLNVFLLNKEKSISYYDKIFGIQKLMWQNKHLHNQCIIQSTEIEKLCVWTLDPNYNMKEWHKPT